MEELFSIQALVHYYDKSSVDHAAVKRLLLSAKIDSLQLLLSDGSTTTLQNYVLIPRLERPSVSDVISVDGEAPATVAAVVMLAEARAAADSIASSSLELDIACSALERLLGSLTSRARNSGAMHLGNELSIDTCTLNRIYRHGLIRRHRSNAKRVMGDAGAVPVSETPSSILTAVNARLRLCDLATHCLAVVARQCVTSEDKCREAVVLSTRLLSLAVSLANSGHDASTSSSFSSRNSLRTALISGAIHIGVIVSENFDIDISPWIRNANHLMLNNSTGSGRTQVIAAVFGGMIPSCSEYRNVHTSKTASRVMMPLSILHSVLEEQLEKTSNTVESKMTQTPKEGISRPESNTSDSDKISKAAQSFLGERVVAAEEDGDEGRISGASGYNACENYIKRAGEGTGIRDLLCSLLLSAVSHYSTIQAQLPQSSFHLTGSLAEDTDALSDGCTSNSEGHPGSIDLFDHRIHMRAFGYRPSSSASDSEQELGRTLSLHREVAVLCIEALSTWLTLEYLSTGYFEIEEFYSLLETVCLNASTLLVSKSISTFDVRAALANYGTVCGSILSQMRASNTRNAEFWDDVVQKIAQKSRHCVVLMKPLLGFAEKSSRAKGMFSCYVTDFLCFDESNAQDETKQKSSEDYLLYMMSLVSKENALDLLRVFSILLFNSSAIRGDSSSPSRMRHYAISVHILDFLAKLAYGLNPSKSTVQISIVRLCHRAVEGSDTPGPEEITSQNEITIEDVANLTPPEHLRSSVQSILPVIEEVLLRMTSQVLNPIWSIVLFNGQERIGSRASFSRVSAQKDLADAGEALLEAFVVLQKTMDTLLGQRQRDPPVHSMSTLKDDPVACFFEASTTEGPEGELLKSLISELQSALMAETPISVSLLFRLECAAKALRCTWRERKRQDVDIYPSLIEVLYGCLKRFAEPLAMEDSQELPGFLGKSWYEELDGYAKSMVRDNFSPNDVHSSPVHGNLATAINYCGHIRSGHVESVVKGLLTELALLIPSDASCLGSSAENDLSMLCDIVCQCWPKYTNIAAKIYNLLKDCVGQVLRKHDAEKWDTKRDLTGTLITLSSWRLFIEKAATCSRTLHVVCHLADMSNSSKDFDDDALALALMDTSYSNYKDIRIPLHVLQSFRPNSLPALISNLLIPQEEAAVAVQSHARSLECFTAACKRNSAWCNALISCLEEYVPKGSELGSTFPVAFFFRKVLTRSVIDSAIMSTAVFDLIDVLAKHGSKSSAIVLETLFRVSSQLFEDQLLLASNDSLYRLLELLIRVCVSYEDIISNKTWGSLSRMYFLADFVKLLVSCLSKLKETVEFPSFTDKQRRLVITMMGLLHICRNGLFQDSTVQIECEKSEATARDESQGHAESKSEPDQTAELKLLEETAPQEESRGSASDGDQRSSGVKAAKENLCTFTTTGSDFVEQHWYFCYTCGLTGTEGVCKVCAAICHDGHDISYSRHSRFFCDCGASGNEAKTIAAVANPAGSSDSEASTRSGRKDNCAESNSSTKRRKCLCLKTEESDSSEAASPSSSEAEVGLDASECDDQSEKPAPSTGDFEMSLLCAVAPLIERCLSSYAQEAKESEETTSEFERSISSMETVNCALDLAQCLLGSGNFFSGKQDLQSSIIPGTWNPLPPVLDKASITKQVITKPVKAAVQPLARIVKILKGGPFSIWGGSGSVRERNLSHSLVGGFPMAMSCFNEHFAVGQEDGSIIFFDTAAVLTCKSALEKSSIEHIGEISVPFPVRYLSFHPDDDETLLVVGDSAVCIVIVSPDPFLEKARVDIELGLSQYGGGIVSSEPHDLSHPPNVLFGADWISYRECALLVKTRAFVKVFDVDKDNVSPALFVPIMPEYVEHKNALSHAESCEEANNNTSPDVAKNTNRVVDIIPLGSWEESEDGSQDLVKTTLLACTRNGDLLFAHRGAEAEELVFTSVLNILSILSWPEEDQVSVIALAKGYNPGIVWIACGNGSLLCICLLVQQTKEGPQSSIRSIHHFINAFEPVSSGFLVPLKCSSEGILLYQKGKSLSVAGVFILDEDMNLSKRFFSGGASSNVMGAICFLPSVVFEKPCCAGGFLASDDGCMYRMDLNFESAQHQFLNDTEMSEISSTLEDMRIERTLSKQNSKNRKGLIQDRYNPVPSTIGYFEKCRPIGENMVLSYSPGAEHGDGSDPDTKVNLGGNTVESIISPIPYATFQFNVAVETSGVLVGARLKFGGSPRSANRIPQSVRVFGREVRWISRNGVKRWLDIPFTVLESAQSPKEVSFELEPQKGQMSESSGFDGLVAVDAIQLFEVSQAEFEDRKLAFDKDAEAFKKSAENPLPNDEVSLDIGEDVRSKSERERLSTLHLFKNFDPRYATALAAIEIACQARELSLESSARLSLTIGAHCLQLVQGAIEAGTSPLPILEENCRRLLREAFKSEFEKYSRSAAAEHIVTSFLDVTRKSIFRSVNQKVINGILPRAVDVEIALYSLRVVSRLWFLLHSSKEETSNAEASETLSSCVPTADVVIHAFDTHMRNSQASRRLYMSPRRVTENAVDTHLILLAASISNKGNPVNMSHAKSLVRMFCDSSQSIRLFSTRRLVYILQDTARLGGISKQLMDTSEDDALKCARCCDMGNGNSWRSDEKEAKSGEGAPTWAYRCDNCADVCEKEWWHCMDCEDFDLCTKCVRLNRSDLSSHNDNSHIFVRGDPEHNLDELNNAAAAESLNDTDNCFLHHGFSVIVAELAKMKKDRNPTYTGPIFFDAAQMISSIIGPHTGYPTRYKYMEQLCASKEFVSRVLNSVSDVVTQFDAMKAICHLNDIARVVRDWDFAFLFLQVFANVRDSLLLPYLFRCGIPEAFAAILKKLEPIASEIFRHAISCSSDSRGGEETKMGTFEKFWSYRSCTMPIVPDDDSSKVGCADIISPGSPFIEDENICPSVSSFLQLTVYIVDFLSFALQSASGPDVDSVHRNVPRGILCDLVSSESRDPRLKGNPELQRLIQLARKLLLAVNGMDEAQMHRVIDTHVYHAHVGELKRSVQEACDSQSKSKYTIQVEVATTLKSLHRLVSKRPSTWREFSTQNPICLEAIYNASLICDSQSEGTALQLMATACSISKEMAAESVRSSAKVAGSSRSTKSDGSPPKPQKIIEDARHDPDVGKTHPNVPVASEDDVRSSNSRNEWIHLCAQSCNKEKQVELDLFSRNSFAVLKRLIFVLLLQRQSSLVRTSCSRILCCIIARAAISNDDDFVLGMYSVLLVALRRMPSAGALGVELGQSLEVFLGFCYEDYFKCLGADRVARVAALLVDALRVRAASLVSHPNAHIYKALASIVDLQGYYLEAEPCATCSTEAFESAPPTTHRLEAIRVEAKFTDSEIMCRLVSAQAVSGVSVKVVDPRRTRRVKKIDLFYSPRIVTDSAELKSANHPWRQFASIALTPSQLESKVELAVPISTANLRFCFSEFYSAEEASSGSGTEREQVEQSPSNSGEEAQRSTEGSSRGNGNAENLQCPRCSRSVTDRHGICRNCHENAFQCRQCRNINYENLDGFLCNECGYCKHGRFEFSVSCKSSFVAEKVVCEEDRKRASLVIEKETMEVHRRHEQLKKMRSTVVQALSLGPKGFGEPEISTDDPRTKPSSITPNITSSRADIAALEALLGGQLVVDTGEAVPPAAEGAGSSEGNLDSGLGALDLSSRRERDNVRTSSHPFSFLTNQGVVMSRHVVTAINSASLSRQTSLLAVLYSKECKSLFLSMSQSIRVLSATRSELMKYAGNSLKRSAPDSHGPESHDALYSSYCGDTSDMVGGINSSPCYGCTQSFLSICVDLLYTIVRFGGNTATNIKNADLALELLRLSSLCERKEVQMRIRRLIVHIVSDNEVASEVVCKEVSRKIEFCIDSFASIDARSIARVELAVLEDIAHIEDRHWEKRFRTVLQLLFRASRTSLSCASVAETIVLPCLRIALHLLRADEGSIPLHVEELRCIGNLQPRSAGGAETGSGKGIMESSPTRSLGILDSIPSNSNGRAAALESEYASTETPPVDVVGVTQGEVIPRQIGDGADSCTSSERRNPYRLESDQMSCSGAPSSIGTGFEEHGSDEDYQSKLTSRNVLDLNGVMASLKEAHGAHESTVNVERWLGGYQTHEEWISAMADRRSLEQGKTEEEQSDLQKTRRYFQKWRFLSGNMPTAGSSDGDISWAVRLILLAPCARVRQLASSLLQALISNEEILVLRLIDVLTEKSLEKAVTVGDGSREFFDLLNKLISPRSNRLYLIAKGFSLRLAKMIFSEAQRLLHVENSLNGMLAFSLSHGFVLHKVVSVLKLLLDEISKMRTAVRVKIFEVEGGVIVRSLQQAYLFIRRLISLRTRLTDECGNTLCEILSSSDYLFFSPTGVIVVQACVSELKSAHDQDDVHTVAVLLEQLCSMLCPETTEPVCYLTLNKAPTQDEYIRGSMTKNPYSSSSFSGPLMRDVKNKICQDLDLPGLLEDDFAMELLVAGNVIKLDLPIMDVYEQVWRGSPVAAMAASSPTLQRNFGSRGSSISGISTGSTMHPLDVFSASRRRGAPPGRSGNLPEERPDPPMVVVYRLSGLDGEATEPIIDALETDSQEDLDLEALYKSTEILGDVGGLEVLLALLSVVGSWGDDAETAVREPALKLLRACCEVSKNRSILAATPGTLSILLDCAASAFEHAHDSVVAVESAESLLIASEKILAVQSLGQVGDSLQEVPEYDTPIQANVSEILARIQVFLGRLSVVSSSKAEASILHLLPFLIQGIPAAVQAAIEHFSFDWSHVDQVEKHQNMARQFATVLLAAPRDYRGQAIVLRALQEGCAADAVKYLLNEFPLPKTSNKETWDVSLTHPGPPAALKLLTGLAHGCGPASVRRNEIRALVEAGLALSDTTIPVLCQLEMTASSNSIGSITEELLEALKEDEGIADAVDRERRNLKAARRAAALASRQAILKETGLSLLEAKPATGEPSKSIFGSEMFDNVVDEVGPACVVCGDGFKSRPDEALGVYVLNRRVPLDCSITAVLASFKSSSNTVAVLGRPTSRRDADHSGSSRSRSTAGSSSTSFCYTTVSQFNAIHISCHREAARSDRSARREEWEGATLRNSQTICNNIIPIQPPMTCTSTPAKGKDSTSGVFNSTAAAVEYYFNRLLSLGRTNLPYPKVGLYDLGRALIRFADGGTQVFSEHSKGGGPHSNACLIPHLVQLILFTLDTSSSPSSPRVALSKNPHVLSQITELQKYLREERTGDIGFYLSASVVLHSPSQWSESMPKFLRLALREVEIPAIALRLIAFTDAVHLVLKSGMVNESFIDSLKEHIGKDEAFSGTFADTVTDLWEKRIKNIKTKNDFWETVSWSSEYYSANSKGEQCRPVKFEGSVKKIDV